MKISFVMFFTIVICGCQIRPHTPALVDISTVGSKPVVHIVKSKNENFKEIVKWYTKDAKNLNTVLKYNGKSLGYQPKVGDSILIPENIVKIRQNYNPASIKPKKTVSQMVKSSGVKKNNLKVIGNDSVSRGKKVFKSDIKDETSSNGGRVGQESNSLKNEVQVNQPVLPDHPLGLDKDNQKLEGNDLDKKRHQYLLELNQK